MSISSLYTLFSSLFPKQFRITAAAAAPAFASLCAAVFLEMHESVGEEIHRWHPVP